MIICRGTAAQAQFVREIKLLHYLTKEMASITSQCSHDDEDCLEVQPTTHYYDLDSIDLSSVSLTDSDDSDNGEDGGSGSGDPCRFETPTTTQVSVPTSGPGSEVTGPGGDGTGPTGPVATVGIADHGTDHHGPGGGDNTSNVPNPGITLGQGDDGAQRNQFSLALLLTSLTLTLLLAVLS